MCIFISWFSFLPAQNADISMLRKIHADSSIVFDKTFKLITKSVTPISIGTPVTMVLTGFINKDEQLKRDGFKTGISLLLAGTLSTSIKFAVHRKRPFVVYPDIIHKKSQAGSMSFPSGHTT
ncbi:MAG: phosphatase PAP2 family protein, partial [Bacteroidia bacterium]